MDRRPKNGREGKSRVQKSGEPQLNSGGRAGRRLQNMCVVVVGGVIQKTVNNGGARTRLGHKNSDRAYVWSIL